MSKNMILVVLTFLTIALCKVDAQVFEVASAVGTGAAFLAKAIGSGKDLYKNFNEGPELNATLAYATLKHSINEIKDKVMELKTIVPILTNLESRSHELQDEINDLNTDYNKFIDYSNPLTNHSESTVLKFCNDLMDHNNGLEKRVWKFHNHIVGKDGLLEKLAKYIEPFNPYCKSKTSRQQYFYGIFLTAMATEFKAYFTMEFIYKRTNKFEEIKGMQNNAIKRINTTTAIFNEVFKKTSQEIYRCDPDQHEKNVSYIKLENVFRWMFYKEQDFSKGWCNYQCPTTNRSHELVAQCHEGNHCKLNQRVCKNVVECLKLGTKDYDGYVACAENNNHEPDEYTFEKKLSWIDFFKRLFKNYHVCEGKKKVEDLLSEYPISSLHGVGSKACAMCQCICDDETSSDRYFSLKPMTSHIRSNKIVTGVRFVKQNHTIFIQIQQGILMPGSFVNNATARWKPIPDDDKVDSENHSESTNVTLKSNKEKVFRLDWFGKRGLYLDDIELEKNEVVTGVKFIVVKNDQQEYLALSVRATKFDPETGKLTTESYWRKPPISQRKKIDLKGYDSPLFVKDENKPHNNVHQFTYFEPLIVTRKDVDHSALPFIDIQPVFSDPPTPLSGVALDIKKNDNSAGFLILKLKTYNVQWL